MNEVCKYCTMLRVYTVNMHVPSVYKRVHDVVLTLSIFTGVTALLRAGLALMEQLSSECVCVYPYYVQGLYCYYISL